MMNMDYNYSNKRMKKRKQDDIQAVNDEKEQDNIQAVNEEQQEHEHSTTTQELVVDDEHRLQLQQQEDI